MDEHDKGEWLDISTQEWTKLASFPYKRHYSYYAVVSRGSDFIYFGGAGDGGNSSRITMFIGAEQKWKEFGFLKHARHA